MKKSEKGGFYMSLPDWLPSRLLYDDIRECKGCNFRNQNEDISPFCFETNAQSIMFLSLVPNIQSTYRPLESVRFFRAVYTALFGYNPNITSPIQAFQKIFYWTHYHKCYFPGYFSKNAEIPPDNCRKRFLDREIEMLRPGLKLIIVAGTELSKKFFGKNLIKGQLEFAKWPNSNIDCILAPFPRSGAEQEFVVLRKRLKNVYGMNEIDDSETKGNFGVQGDKEASFKEFMEYELNALQKYWESLAPNTLAHQEKYKNSDERWMGMESTPRMYRYSFVVTCDSFVEDHAKAFLGVKGQFDREDLYPMIKDELSGPKLTMMKNLCEDLRAIRQIRNAIVHEGGICHKDIDSKIYVEREPNGTLILNNGLCEEILKTVKRFVGIIV